MYGRIDIIQGHSLVTRIGILQDIGDFAGNPLCQVFRSSWYGHRQAQLRFFDDLVPRRRFQRIIPALHLYAIAISVTIAVFVHQIRSIQFFLIIAQSILIRILKNIFCAPRLIGKNENSRTKNKQTKKKKQRKLRTFLRKVEERRRMHIENLFFICVCIIPHLPAYLTTYYRKETIHWKV